MNFNWKSDFESSQLAAYAYDAPTKTLAIRFVSTDSVYHYFDVPETIYFGLNLAESKGSFFIHNIKRSPFRYERQPSTQEKPICPPNP